MSFLIKPATPTNSRLLIALAGPQASGKTTSALRLASGIVKETGGKICLIDTENKRALRYAQNFSFNHMDFPQPYNPARYQEAIESAVKQGYGVGDVIIIDSMSHEHDGPGGVLEMHESYLEKNAGDDYKKLEKLKFTAWIKPKSERSRCIQIGLNQCPAHIILCFRAKEKVKMEKDDQNKTVVLNDGWQPIGGDEYFFEMDITMILPQGSFGKPDWSEKACRINEYGDGPLKNLLYNTQQISEHTGQALAKINNIVVNKDRPPHVTMAQNIANKIKAATNPQDVHDIMSVDYVDDIETIKSANIATHEWLVKLADEKIKDLQEPR